MRTSILSLLSLTIIVCASAAPVPKAVKKRPDAEVFVGSWDTVVSEENRKERVKATWTFDEKLKMTSISQGGAGPGSEWQIKIDPEKTPKEIEITNYRGIYEFDGEDIRIVYMLGGERPTSFDPKPGVYYVVLRRVKEGK